jgi:DNA-directed RNA polymerase specialized sigma24 family protein
VEPRPLTHYNKDGELYVRTDKVEQQIRDLSDVPTAELIANAQIEEEDDLRYIQVETLVYFIRERVRSGRALEASDLVDILINRCTKFIQGKLYKLGFDHMEQASQDVLGDLVKDIADTDSDRADFLEVRFWRALDVRATNAFSRYYRLVTRNTFLSSAFNENSPNGDEPSEEDGLEGFASRRLSAEEWVLIRDALASIEEPYRTVFVQYHQDGWPIESKDPNKLTISRNANRTPRTIRNWLQKAEEALQKWREEVQ